MALMSHLADCSRSARNPSGRVCLLETTARDGGCCTNPGRGRWIVSKRGLRNRPSRPSRAAGPSEVVPHVGSGVHFRERAACSSAGCMQQPRRSAVARAGSTLSSSFARSSVAMSRPARGGPSWRMSENGHRRTVPFMPGRVTAQRFASASQGRLRPDGELHRGKWSANLV
jgi:hypothetical protein